MSKTDTCPTRLFIKTFHILVQDEVQRTSHGYLSKMKSRSTIDNAVEILCRSTTLTVYDCRIKRDQDLENAKVISVTGHPQESVTALLKMS